MAILGIHFRKSVTGFGVVCALVAYGVIQMSYSNWASATDSSPQCPERFEFLESLNVTQIQLKSGKCLLKVMPTDTSRNYRSYLVNSEGMFMVFNSFAQNGTNSSTTGSRVFYFFPRSKSISYQVLSSGSVVLGSAAKVDLVISAENSRIASMSNASFSELPEIAGGNKGGVEINQIDGILLDSGWKKGGTPSENLSGTSTFTDSRGTHCQVINSRVFEKTSGNVRFKYSDDQLAEFLKVQCKNFDVSPLL